MPPLNFDIGPLPPLEQDSEINPARVLVATMDYNSHLGRHQQEDEDGEKKH